MNAPANTPATTTETPANESAITKFIKSLPKDHKANKSDQKAAATAFKAFMAKKAAAEKVLKDLEAEEQTVAQNMIAAYGKNRISVEGVEYVASCRDERIFYKVMGGKGVEI
jgi:hypothetical protein